MKYLKIALFTLPFIVSSMSCSSSFFATEDPANMTPGELFRSYCASCHRVDIKMIGPALKGAKGRWEDEKLMVEFIHNSSDFVAKYPNHAYANKLYEEYNRSLMSERSLTDAQILSIMNWVETQ
ncbi:c-type cytochrome [bacterium SCSIO 12741]|nr:c-type cytochrome [bacterium SCSIO 12741]